MLDNGNKEISYNFETQECEIYWRSLENVSSPLSIVKPSHLMWKESLKSLKHNILLINCYDNQFHSIDLKMKNDFLTKKHSNDI